jgi:hypothetical protein
MGTPVATVYLRPDDSVAYALVARTDAQRAANLIAAYTAAKLLTPNGAALSASNRAKVVVAPGNYDFTAYKTDGTTTPGLTIDTDYVDFEGVGNARLYSSSNNSGHTATKLGPTCLLSAYDVRLTNLQFDVAMEQSSTHRCRSFEIASGQIVTGGSATTIQTTPYLLVKSGGFVGVQAGDWCEIYGGSISLRRSYRVLANLSNNALQLDGTDSDILSGPPEASSADVNFIVRRTCANSIFRGLRFRRQIATETPGGDIFGNGHIDGSWYDCTSELDDFVHTTTPSGAGGWRQYSFCHVLGTFERCNGKEFCLGGDGDPGGNPGLDSAITAYLGPFITVRRCNFGASSFAGCTSFGGRILAGAVFEDCTAGKAAFAPGNSCAGTFRRCTAGWGSFGGYTGNDPNNSAASTSLMGTFSGVAQDCTSGPDSFGTGTGAAGTAVEGNKGVLSGTVTRCLQGTDSQLAAGQSGAGASTFSGISQWCHGAKPVACTSAITVKAFDNGQTYSNQGASARSRSRSRQRRRAWSTPSCTSRRKPSTSPVTGRTRSTDQRPIRAPQTRPTPPSRSPLQGRIGL